MYFGYCYKYTPATCFCAPGSDIKIILKDTEDWSNDAENSALPSLTF